MKKELIFVLAIFMIVGVFAVPELYIPKNDFQPGETLIGNLSGAYQNIYRNSLEFYEGRNQVFFERAVYSFNGTQYFYVYFNRAGNFTMKIDGVLYKEDGILKEARFENNFTVAKKVFLEGNESGNPTAVSKIIGIEPGVVFSGEPKSFKIYNRGNVSLNVSYFSKVFEIEPLKNIEVLVENPTQFSFFEVKSYESFFVPLIFYDLNLTTNGSAFEDEVEILRTNPELIHLTFNYGTTEKTKLELFNFGEANLSKIEFEYDEELIKMDELENLGAKEMMNLSLNVSAPSEGYFERNVSINYTFKNNSYKLVVPVVIYSLAKNVSLEEVVEIGATCSELGGVSCNNNERCIGEPKFASDGYCCIGSCEEIKVEEEDGSLLWLWGLLILAGLGAVGYFVYLKLKKIKPQSVENQMKEVDKKYSQRLVGGQKIMGGLTRN